VSFKHRLRPPPLPSISGPTSSWTSWRAPNGCSTTAGRPSRSCLPEKPALPTSRASASCRKSSMSAATRASVGGSLSWKTTESRSPNTWFTGWMCGSTIPAFPWKPAAPDQRHEGGPERRDPVERSGRLVNRRLQRQKRVGRQRRINRCRPRRPGCRCPLSAPGDRHHSTLLPHGGRRHSPRMGAGHERMDLQQCRPFLGPTDGEGVSSHLLLQGF